MAHIEEYLYDGACFQARQVLAKLASYYSYIVEATWNKDWKDYEMWVEVGRYENCREQGYVFTLRTNGKQRNYAVYEHRNSDNIIVLISNTFTLNTPNVEQMWADKGDNPSKYDYDKDFKCDECNQCADWIINDMRKWIDENFVSDFAKAE